MSQRSEISGMAPTDLSRELADALAHQSAAIVEIAALPTGVAEKEVDVSHWKAIVRIVLLRNLQRPVQRGD